MHFLQFLAFWFGCSLVHFVCYFIAIKLIVIMEKKPYTMDGDKLFAMLVLGVVFAPAALVISGMFFVGVVTVFLFRLFKLGFYISKVYKFFFSKDLVIQPLSSNESERTN